MPPIDATGLLLTFARRGEDDAIRQALGRLRVEGAVSVISVGTPVSAPVLSELGCDEVIIYGDGRNARAAITDLRRRRLAMAALIYSDASYAGHLKLEVLALLSGAGWVQRIAPGASSAISRFSLAASVLAKGLSACALAVIGTVICTAAFVCLTLRQTAAGGRRAHRP